MIRLFRRDETNFDHNEWVLSEVTKCKVTEITNGNFEVDLEQPVQDKKGLSKYLTTGNIIKCDVGDSRGEQLFRIRKVSGDKTKTVFAQSKLIADLSSNRVQAMTIAGKTRKEAIQLVLNAALDPHTYVVGNKDANTNNSFIVNIQEGSVLNALVGSENSILSAYGGEFIIDNDTIDIVDARGTDRGFDIRYGKNIKGITATEDDTDLATVIIPKVGDLRLPEYTIESTNVNSYEKRYFKELEIDGLNVWDGKGEKGADQITQSEAFIKMREAANLLFTKDHIDLINFSYELDLAILSKTEEYKSKKYYLMEDVFLGDTVKVYHEIHNIDLFGKISKTVYNVLLGRYDSVTVGFQKQNITDIINQTVRNIKFTKEEILMQVGNLSNKTKASLKIAADNIKALVEGIGASTSLDLLTNVIQASVIENGFQSTLEQSARAIRIAWNNISNYAEINDTDGLILGDSNSGTYSKVGYNGRLELMLEGSTHPLHCLTYTDYEELTVSGDDYDLLSINLPSMFDGIPDEDIAVSVSVQKVYKDGYYLPYWFGGYGEVINGVLKLRAMSAWRSYSTTSVVDDVSYDSTDGWVTDVDSSYSSVIGDIGSPVGGGIILRYTIIA